VRIVLLIWAALAFAYGVLALALEGGVIWQIAGFLFALLAFGFAGVIGAVNRLQRALAPPKPAAPGDAGPPSP
jgi:hypothetical protein